MHSDSLPKKNGAKAGDGLSPGMRQYLEIKSRYPGSILFFHIGDFYETFLEDAEIVSRELEIILTSRSKGGEDRIPLAGVPYHAAEGYIARLVAKGYKVAVCDQLEDARKAKGIVKRDVVRVITPGTAIDPSMLPGTDALYLMSLCPVTGKDDWGLAFLDVSTGDFFVTGINQDNPASQILSEVSRYNPVECILPGHTPAEIISLLQEHRICVTKFRDDAFDYSTGERTLKKQFNVLSLAGYGCEGMPGHIGAASAALCYAREMQNSDLSQVSGFSTRAASGSMLLDAVTLRNLEIAESIRPGQKGATLLSFLNRTQTPMGSRLLRARIIRPLVDAAQVAHRLDAVEFFIRMPMVRLSLHPLLKGVADLERLAGRIAFGNAGPRDLIALSSSIQKIPEIRRILAGDGARNIRLIDESASRLVNLPHLVDHINRALVDDPPASHRNGGIIRDGYSHELDEMRQVLRGGKDWISDLQDRERQRTGIKSLKIGYNRIFGYYIEVTRPNLHLVPPDYERKQTTATGERYTIADLRTKESLISQADEGILRLEQELYENLVRDLRRDVPSIQKIGQGIGEIDLYCALAEVARANGYVRPVVDDNDRIVIRDGRHPVVERTLPEGYVPNDTDLSGTGTRIMIITGANMAGKSTYMRACALICIMAQTGCFVPASHAAIGIVDRIFTRVGAFDDLASGQSTFMVEMLELANILNNVTPKSLAILDEIGRGTSTVDGYAIARSVLEFLHGKSRSEGVKTLFATHFHELVGIEADLSHVKNFHFAVRETKNDIIFLRKLIPGATDRSYGIHVARRAGIPAKVTARADLVLSDALNGKTQGGGKVQRYTQLLLSDAGEATTPTTPDPLREALQKLNPDDMTPMQALKKLHELKSSLRSDEGRI